MKSLLYKVNIFALLLLIAMIVVYYLKIDSNIFRFVVELFSIPLALLVLFSFFYSGYQFLFVKKADYKLTFILSLIIVVSSVLMC